MLDLHVCVKEIQMKVGLDLDKINFDKKPVQLPVIIGIMISHVS